MITEDYGGRRKGCKRLERGQGNRYPHSAGDKPLAAFFFAGHNKIISRPGCIAILVASGAGPHKVAACTPTATVINNAAPVRRSGAADRISALGSATSRHLESRPCRGKAVAVDASRPDFQLAENSTRYARLAHIYVQSCLVFSVLAGERERKRESESTRPRCPARVYLCALRSTRS